MTAFYYKTQQDYSAPDESAKITRQAPVIRQVHVLPTTPPKKNQFQSSISNRNKPKVDQEEMTYYERGLKATPKTKDEIYLRDLQTSTDRLNIEKPKASWKNTALFAGLVSGLSIASYMVASPEIANAAHTALPTIQDALFNIGKIAAISSAASLGVWGMFKSGVARIKNIKLEQFKDEHSLSAYHLKEANEDSINYDFHEKFVNETRAEDRECTKTLANNNVGRTLILEQRFGYENFQDFKKTKKSCFDSATRITSKFQEAAQKAKKSSIYNFVSGAAGMMLVLAPSVTNAMSSGKITEGVAVALTAGLVSAAAFFSSKAIAKNKANKVASEIIEKEKFVIDNEISNRAENREKSRLAKEGNTMATPPNTPDPQVSNPFENYDRIIELQEQGELNNVHLFPLIKNKMRA